jgi:hypothetical protein
MSSDVKSFSNWPAKCKYERNHLNMIFKVFSIIATAFKAD